MTDIASPATASLQPKRKLVLDPLWVALPGIAFLILFLIVPTAQILSLSLIDKITGALTFAPFVKIWSGGPYLAVLGTTFSVALWTTALCLVLGYPLGYWLCRQAPPQPRIGAPFVFLPILASALIQNFFWPGLLRGNGS